MLSKILILILIVYVAGTQYIIGGYSDINDKLQVSLDNLMSVCSNSPKNDLDDVY